MQCTKCNKQVSHGCARLGCPVFASIAGRKIPIEGKQEFSGKAPNIFVGRHGYPDINVGFLSVEKYENHDNPLLWSKEGYTIPKIMDLRSSLVNSNLKANVRSFGDRLVEMGQEIGMAQDPVDMEIKLNKKPVFSTNFEPEAMPHGPNVRLKNARITENPKIPNIVEKAFSDTDLKASEALKSLGKKIDEHHLTRLLSSGTLGLKTQRKLVPTRWSITAVDDTLSKEKINTIKDYKLHEMAVFFGGYLGNYYIALVLPDIWGYELFETHVTPGEPIDLSNLMTDHEGYEGRKDYASSTAGGYYAARLSLLEYLEREKKQARVILLRLITDEYSAPLGVWVVREAVRKTFASKPVMFESEELLLNYAKGIAKKRFSVDCSILIKLSKLLSEKRSQTRLTSF